MHTPITRQKIKGNKLVLVDEYDEEVTDRLIHVADIKPF
jgi:hypothetical protein